MLFKDFVVKELVIFYLGGRSGEVIWFLGREEGD